MNKTNAMRILYSHKINYEVHEYEANNKLTGTEIANLLGENPDAVFKTLVTISKSKEYFVFMIPVNKELDLKKAAKAVNEKNVEMIPSKELLKVTGYVHGGCSPIGMKKPFKVTINESFKYFDKIYFSGGKVGLQISTSTSDLIKLINPVISEITF